MKEHQYSPRIKWTGNLGEGTFNYKAYSRDYEVKDGDRPELLCSSDPTFRGNPKRYNPENLLVASISGCHMLWFLHLCAKNNIVVVDYFDEPSGTMIENDDGSGQFKEVVLNPTITLTDKTKIEKATQLHEEANKKCFIAASCNFKISHKPKIEVKQSP